MSNDVMAPDSKNIPGVIKDYVPDPRVQQEVENTLVTARVSLLFNQPFWGQLVCRMELIDASGWVPTAATDGRCFYYNVNFIKSLESDELLFLFAHEVMHVAYNHFMRRSNRDPKLFNAAADYAINGELVECGLGKMPSMGLYDKRFHDYDAKGNFYSTWASETIYDWLQQNAEMQKVPIDCEMDVHIQPDGEGEGEGDGDGDEGDQEGNGSGYTKGDANNRPKISPEAAKEIGRQMKDALINASKSVDQNSKSAGSIPAGMRRMIREWTDPKIRWQDLFETSIKTQIKSDFTYLRPHRRGELDGGIILPGWDVEEAIQAHVAIDTSGSMSDKMLKEIMSEIRGIMNQFTMFELHVWCFDGQVWQESYKVFNAENLDDINQYKLYGGGGTLFESNWEWMKMNEIEPDTLLLFTDGYPCGSWGDEKYCDTIFCIHGDINKSLQAPFGITVWYEDGQRKKR